MPSLNSNIPLGWKIIVEDGPLSGSQASFEPDSTTAMIPYRVPRDDLQIVPQSFTGYSYRFNPIGAGSASLRRVLPQPHPFWEGLWANRVSSQGETGWDSTNTLKANFHGPYDAYDAYRAEVFYGRRPYPVKGNDEVTKEQQRYVEKLPGRPSSEVVSLEGGQLQFLTRNGVAVADGAIIPNGTNFRVGKVEHKWIWHEVPIPWVCNSNGLMTNISPYVGTINSSLWEGFSAECLYLQSVDTEYTYATATPSLLGLPSSDPPRYIKITFNFIFFNEGWNKLPYPGLGTWDTVAFKNNTSQKLFDTTNFDTLFQAV